MPAANPAFYDLYIAIKNLLRVGGTISKSMSPAPAPTGPATQGTVSYLPQGPTITQDACGNVAGDKPFENIYIARLAECCASNRGSKTCREAALNWSSIVAVYDSESVRLVDPDGRVTSIFQSIASSPTEPMVSVMSVGGSSARAAMNAAMQKAIANKKTRLTGALAEMYPQTSSAPKLRLGSLTTKQVVQSPTIRLGNLSVPTTSTPRSPVLAGITKLSKSNQTVR